MPRRSPRFATLPLTTAAYSAVLIVSSKNDPADPAPQDLNEDNSTPDTDAINAPSPAARPRSRRPAHGVKATRASDA